MEVKRITFRELGESKDWKEAVIVFTNRSFGVLKQYTLEERSYKVSSDAKWFDNNKNGMSLFGDCLDGKDNGVRLDHYMRLTPEEGKRWEVEYCYITK
jgi:hypothetical protein